MASSSSSSSPTPVELLTAALQQALQATVGDRMPDPASRLIPQFEGTDVTLFLEKYNHLADRAGLSSKEKCQRIFDYCTPEMRGTFRFNTAYKNGDWDALAEKFKEKFQTRDSLQYSMAYLQDLITAVRADPAEITLEEFVPAYHDCSEFLCSANKLSQTERILLFCDVMPSNFLQKANKAIPALGHWLIDQAALPYITKVWLQLVKIAKSVASEVQLQKAVNSRLQAIVQARDKDSLITPSASSFVSAKPSNPQQSSVSNSKTHEDKDVNDLSDLVSKLSAYQRLHNSNRLPEINH